MPDMGHCWPIKIQSRHQSLLQRCIGSNGSVRFDEQPNFLECGELDHLNPIKYQKGNHNTVDR